MFLYANYIPTYELCEHREHSIALVCTAMRGRTLYKGYLGQVILIVTCILLTNYVTLWKTSYSNPDLDARSPSEYMEKMQPTDSENTNLDLFLYLSFKSQTCNMLGTRFRYQMTKHAIKMFAPCASLTEP